MAKARRAVGEFSLETRPALQMRVFLQARLLVRHAVRAGQDGSLG